MLYPLFTERLSIQPLDSPDLEAFITYRQEPDVARYQGWELPYLEHQGIELLESQRNVLLPTIGHWLQYAIHDRLTGELLGDLALHFIEEKSMTFEIGFTLAGKNQGNGIAREAVKRFLTFLFEVVNAGEVVANCDQRNYAAAKLLLSLGFEKNPSENWNELFKNELVTIEHFELKSTKSRTV